MVEHISVHILDQSLSENVAERLTQTNSEKIARALDREGITAALSEEKPWDGYTTIMDGIAGADTSLGEHRPELTTTRVNFFDRAARDAFASLGRSSLAGIHGYDTMPVIERDGPKSLQLQQFSYADLSTLGRVATAVFTRQFESTLGANFPLVRATIQDIRANGSMEYLPPELAKRVRAQDERLTPEIGPSLLSSGSLALVGAPMRNALRSEGLPLALQRPKQNRTLIEKGVNVISAENDEIPISIGTLRGVVKALWANRLSELVDPFKVRDPDSRNTSKAAEGVWDAVTGGLVAKAVSLAFETTLTIGKAVPGAVLQTSQRRQDARTLRREANRDAFWEKRTR